MYSNYCRNSLLCKKYCMYCMFVCVINCQCQSLWCNALYKLKTKANRLVTKTQIMSPFCPNWSSNKHNLQHLPLTKGSTLISSRDPTVVCHMVLITFHCPRNVTRTQKTSVFRCAFRKRCPCDYSFSVTVIRPPRSLSLTHCWTNQRKTCTVSCLKQQHSFCVIDLYDHYC